MVVLSTLVETLQLSGPLRPPKLTLANTFRLIGSFPHFVRMVRRYSLSRSPMFWAKSQPGCRLPLGAQAPRLL